MNNEQILVDASPLIVLIKSELDHLLPAVFERVLVTGSVLNEILAGPENDLARIRIAELPWLIQTQLRP